MFCLLENPLYLLSLPTQRLVSRHVDHDDLFVALASVSPEQISLAEGGLNEI